MFSKSTILAALPLLLSALSAYAAVFQGGINDPSTSGSSVYASPDGSSTLRGKTIDNNYYSPGSTPGTVSNNVNLMTGQPVYQVPIGTLNANGEVSFPIVLEYNGQTRQLFDADNERGPTSWIGFGWNFSTPFVSVNHKGTVTHLDDVFYCFLGGYGGGQILQNPAGDFFVSEDPTLKISVIKDVEGLIQQWNFQTASGVKLTFGLATAGAGPGNTSVRSILRTGNMLGVSPYNMAGAKEFIYRWDISSLTDYSGNNKIQFSYRKFEKAWLGASKSYTRESYIEAIVWNDRLGNEIERYSFVTANKTPAEYAVGSLDETLAQRLYETQKLVEIQHSYKGTADKSWILNHFVKTFANQPVPYAKMRLMGIQPQFPNPRGGVITDPKMKWVFTYDDGANRHSGLKTIKKPNVGKEEFFYELPDYSTYANGQESQWAVNSKQDPAMYTLRGDAGEEIQLPANNNVTLNEWENQTSCSERFCIVAAIWHNTAPDFDPGSCGSFGCGTEPPGDNLKISVYKNNGNRFELALLGTSPFRTGWKTAFRLNTISILPWNDNFILLDALGKTFMLYEWNGKSFTMHDKMIKRKDANGTLNNVPVKQADKAVMSITLGSDYFIVTDQVYNDPCTNTPNTGSNVYVIKKINGVWQDLNQETECADPAPATRCKIGNAGDFGETIKSGTNTGCMAFNDKELLVSATPDMFHVVDSLKSIVLTYALRADGQGFDLISNLYQDIGAAIQVSGKNMNWTSQILEPIKSGTDYFMVKSRKGTDSRYDVMHYDGLKIAKIFTVGPYPDDKDGQYGWTLNAFTSGEYFVISDQKRLRTEFHPKTVTYAVGGAASAISFAGVDCTIDVPAPGAGDVVIRTAPNAYTIEYFPDKMAVGGNPKGPPLVANDNYRTFLFVVDASIGFPYAKAYLPDVGGFLDDKNRNLFDLSFSYTDNMVTGKSCHVEPAGGACSPTSASQTMNFYTGLFLPGAVDNNFVKKKKKMWTSLTGFTTYDKHYVVSNAARIGVECLFDLTSKKVIYSLKQSMGNGFVQYPYEETIDGKRQSDMEVVTKFVSYSDLTGPAGSQWNWRTEYPFFYTRLMLPPSSTDFIPSSTLLPKYPEYNAHTQTFMIPNTVTGKFNKSDNGSTNPGGEVAVSTSHFIDEAAAPIGEDEAMKIGKVANQQVYKIYNRNGTYSFSDMVAKSTFDYYPPAWTSPWPANLKIMRLKGVGKTEYSPNGSPRSTALTYHAYNPENNQPLFTKTKIGNLWYLNQSLFQTGGVNKSLAFGSRVFRFNSPIDEAGLNGWPYANVPYSYDDADLKTVSASQVEFDPVHPFKVKLNLVWKDHDDLSDEELMRGADPIFLSSMGYEARLSNERRNDYGQILETSKILSEANGLDRRTSYFYEGRASLPIAIMENANLDDVAVLSAENSDIPTLSTHDWEGRWAKDDAGGTSLFAHTGKFSIKVIDKPGPTVNLMLKDVVAQKYDYVVSAWVYCQTATLPPMLSVKLYAHGNPTAYFTRDVQAPVMGHVIAQKWQRYELKISHAELRGSGNHFAVPNSGDILTVSIGTGPKADNPLKVVYVDDIICRPSTASYTGSAYDERNRLTSATGNEHLTTLYEYDVFGNLTGHRDDKHRMFGSQATHFPGEND